MRKFPIYLLLEIHFLDTPRCSIGAINHLKRTTMSITQKINKVGSRLWCRPAGSPPACSACRWRPCWWCPCGRRCSPGPRPSPAPTWAARPPGPAWSAQVTSSQSEAGMAAADQSEARDIRSDPGSCLTFGHQPPCTSGVCSLDCHGVMSTQSWSIKCLFE